MLCFSGSREGVFYSPNRQRDHPVVFHSCGLCEKNNNNKIMKMIIRADLGIIESMNVAVGGSWEFPQQMEGPFLKICSISASGPAESRAGCQQCC